MIDTSNSLVPSGIGRATAWLVALVVAAALVAQRRSTVGDIGALGLLMCAALLARRSGAGQFAAALIGMAAGLVPLAALALIPRFGVADRRAGWRGLLIAVAAGVAVFLAVRTISPQLIDTASITAGLAELAFPNLWAEVARWVAPLMPVVALGLIGAMARLRLGLATDATDEVPSARAHTLWLSLNAAALFIWPRYVAAHLLIWIVPFAVLAPHGWAAAMTLLDRAPGVFLRATAVAFLALMAWWIWLPVRAVRDAALVAWFGS